MERLDDRGLDGGDLDRHITGNYGEDQLSCSDPDDPLYEPYGSDVEEDFELDDEDKDGEELGDDEEVFDEEDD